MIDVQDLVRYMHSIGKVTRFKIASDNTQVTCPFPHYKDGDIHFDTNPSLGIRHETGVWHCFGCGERGVIEDLVVQWLDIPLADAINWLASRYILDEKGFRRVEKLKLFDLPDYESLFGSKVYMDVFPEEYFAPFRQIHKYTLDRGFTQRTAIKYDIGYDSQTHRIVMPLRLKGYIIGLYGRTVRNDEPNKYLYYNYDYQGNMTTFPRKVAFLRCKQIPKPTCVVVESGLDVPWADQNGLTEHCDVFSILSSGITKYQVEILSQYDEIVCALDNDWAGEIGTSKLVKELKNRVKLTMWHYPQDAKDLGDLNGEQMISCFNNRKSYINTITSKLSYQS